ncbi:MAG: histidine kinase [Limnoraphis sp.]
MQDIFDKVKAFSLGGSDYITKPFQEQEVLARIENQLRLIRLSKQLIDQNILQERNRIAGEIHDSLAQVFTGIILHLGAAERSLENTPSQALSHFKIVHELAKNGLAEARRSVTALRPHLLENVDLYSALNRIAIQMSSYSETRTILEVIGTVYPLSLEIENNLLRIGQEALTNAFKYAKASQINIELIYESKQFFLRIKDNGQGFDVESPCFRSGFGFLGMKERADRMGAKLMITSEVGKGTEILVSVEL